MWSATFKLNDGSKVEFKADDMTESGMTMGDYFPPGYEVSEIGRVRASGDIHMMTNCYEEVR